MMEFCHECRQYDRDLKLPHAPSCETGKLMKQVEEIKSLLEEAAKWLSDDDYYLSASDYEGLLDDIRQVLNVDK